MIAEAVSVILSLALARSVNGLEGKSKFLKHQDIVKRYILIY